MLNDIAFKILQRTSSSDILGRLNPECGVLQITPINMYLAAYDDKIIWPVCVDS